MSPAAAAGIAALLTWLGLQFAGQLLLFAIARYETLNRLADRGEPGPSLWRTVIPFLCEYCYSLLYGLTHLAVALGRIAGPVKSTLPAQAAPARPLVVLIHGYLARPAHFLPLRLWLAANGVPNVARFAYAPGGTDPDEYHHRLRDFVAESLAATGCRETILIGHSFGGVMAHDFVREFGGRYPVRLVVALAAPFHGSRLAVMAITKLARSLHPADPRFASVSGPLPCRLVSIYTRHDQFVLPYSSSIHPRADENVELSRLGHSGFYYAPSVLQKVAREVVADHHRGAAA